MRKILIDFYLRLDRYEADENNPVLFYQKKTRRINFRISLISLSRKN